MDSFILWVQAHAEIAHFAIFGAILLAGLNVPISIDAILIATAILASTIIPENRVVLFLSFYFGCVMAAWISYGMGRFFGNKLLKTRWVGGTLTPEKIEKVKRFYIRWGFLTLAIGRFIPFGVRNCIYMSTGMSKMSFATFAIRDSIACLIWTSIVFTLFYRASQDYKEISHHLMLVGSILLGIVLVAAISWICYKKIHKNPVKKPTITKDV